MNYVQNRIDKYTFVSFSDKVDSTHLNCTDIASLSKGVYMYDVNKGIVTSARLVAIKNLKNNNIEFVKNEVFLRGLKCPFLVFKKSNSDTFNVIKDEMLYQYLIN